ncbi:MAG: GNAT family N-acetyltransferase [Candidatus Ventricola sp.]
MQFRQINTGKKRYLDLLLLADEQEDMIDRYLERGELIVLEDGGRTRAVCVVTDEGNGVFEVKNLAVAPDAQRRGYGRAMLRFVEERCRSRARVLIVGTGDSPLTVPFYEACGFTRDRVIENFFTDHYDHPIVEAGVTLRDMIVLKKELRP